PLSDLLKKLDKEQSTNAQGNPAPNGGGAGTMMRRVASGGGNLSVVAQTEMDTTPQAQAVVAINTFQDVVTWFGQQKEPLIQAAFFHHAHLVKFGNGHLELRIADDAPKALIGDVSSKMNEWTGDRWSVSVSRAEGQPT